jgi:hypothetical protein
MIMFKALRALALALPLVFAGAAAAQTATVNFIEPQKFRDATFTGGPAVERERAEVLREIEAHLQSLAKRHLRSGQTLVVDVRDIDLAGHLEPFWRAAGEIRVLRAVTWPAIELRYRLTEGAVTLAEGDERIADLNYQWRTGAYFHGDRLRYEKAMLDDWFERRFVRQRKDG